MKRGRSGAEQWTCNGNWIHRRRIHLTRKKRREYISEIQCPMCGWKLELLPDEFHDEVEAEHKQRCRILNPKVRLADESRYG